MRIAKTLKVFWNLVSESLSETISNIAPKFLKFPNMGYGQVHDDQVKFKSLIDNKKHSNFLCTKDLIWLEWNWAKWLGPSKIDTTCTIWDIWKEIVDTQLIAHDKEVYAIAWGFISVSADGSVQVLDLRNNEHLTIVYERTKPDISFLWLGWNKQVPRYMATILMDSSKVVVLFQQFQLQNFSSTKLEWILLPGPLIALAHIWMIGDDSPRYIVLFTCIEITVWCTYKKHNGWGF